MNEEQAWKLLQGCIEDDNGLHSLGWYLGWDVEDDNAVLDGDFTADELSAIAWWMKNKGE